MYLLPFCSLFRDCFCSFWSFLLLSSSLVIWWLSLMLCLDSFLFLCVYIYYSLCLLEGLYIAIYIFIYVCIYIHTCVYTYIHIHIHIHIYIYICWLFGHSVMSDSLPPHGLQHARLPCPSPSSGTCSNSYIPPHTHDYFKLLISSFQMNFNKLLFIPLFPLVLFFKLFIYLIALGLSRGTQDLYCIMWNLPFQCTDSRAVVQGLM